MSYIAFETLLDFMFGEDFEETNSYHHINGTEIISFVPKDKRFNRFGTFDVFGSDFGVRIQRSNINEAGFGWEISVKRGDVFINDNIKLKTFDKVLPGDPRENRTYRKEYWYSIWKNDTITFGDLNDGIKIKF